MACAGYVFNMLVLIPDESTPAVVVKAGFSFFCGDAFLRGDPP